MAWYALIENNIGVKVLFEENRVRTIAFASQVKLPVSAQTGSLNEWQRSVVDKIRLYLQGSILQLNDIKTITGGSEFQNRVWRAIAAIPYGETRTYKEVAAQIFSHPRAVGQACRSNPIPLIVPCHRVVSINTVNGFAGKICGPVHGYKIKLIEMERNKLRGEYGKAG